MIDLTQPISDCPCGRLHTCSVRRVEIGEGALTALPALCRDYRHILLVADKNTARVCGDEVASLLHGSVEVYHIFRDEGVVIPNEDAVDAVDACITPEIDLIVGVGSGVINDICKFVGHRRGLPYIIVATAPSMDGYASAGAAMILDGMKVTPSATPPMAIVADTEVLKNAPMDMIRAGYGDIIGKFSCLNDWKLAAFIRGEYFCQTVYDLVMATACRVRDLAEDIARRDGAAVAALMEALVEVGIAMAYVGNSRPASGSEHHLSHFFEITGILGGTPYLPHGTDVAYASVLTARLREEILRRTPTRMPFDQGDYEAAIRRVYTDIGDAVIAQQERLGWYHEDGVDEFVLTHTEGIREILSEAPDEAEVREMVEAVGLSMEELYGTYGESHIEDAIKYAKDLKDRYSVLWVHNLYYM